MCQSLCLSVWGICRSFESWLKAGPSPRCWAAGPPCGCVAATAPTLCHWPFCVQGRPWSYLNHKHRLHPGQALSTDWAAVNPGLLPEDEELWPALGFQSEWVVPAACRGAHVHYILYLVCELEGPVQNSLSGNMQSLWWNFRTVKKKRQCFKW